MKAEKGRLKKELRNEIRWRASRIQKIKTKVKRAIKCLTDALTADEQLVEKRAQAIQQLLAQMETTSDSD